MRLSPRRALPTVALAAALFVTAGCSTTSPHQISSTSVAETERQIFGDLEAHEFSKRMQVRLPAKLAVADVTGENWDGRDKRRLVQAVTGLGEDGDTYTDVVSLTATGAETLEELRHQAATHQADLELILLRREEVHANSTGLGILNLLIVPMFVVPTQSNDVRLTVRAMVRDVRNGLVYTTFDDHEEARVWSSFAGETTDLRRTSDELFDACVSRMRDTLARKLAALDRASR